MALSTAIAWEVQTGGSDANNSGGFRGGAFISAPSTPSVSNSASGGTVAANTYYVVITYTDGLGETVISPQSSTTTTGSVSTITVTSPGASTGALTWSCYVATVSGGPYFPQGTGLTIGSNRVITTTPPTTGTQPRGVDRSLLTSRQVTIDNSTITATTTGANSNTLTFTGGYVPTGADVGNTLRTTAGTNINVGIYEITAITSTTWTVTGAANLTTAGGAGSAVVGGMGGCFASPGQACSILVNSNIVFVKAGTYTVNGGTNNTAGNKFTITNAYLSGYSTNRNLDNTDTPPVLDAGANAMTVMSMTGSPYVNNLSITNSGAHTTVIGWAGASGGNAQIRQLSVTGCSSSGTGSYVNYTLVDCSDSGCGGMGTSSTGNTYVRYVSRGGTATFGMSVGAGCSLFDCIVTGQTGTATVGIQTGSSCVVSNCIATGNSVTNAKGIFVNGSHCTVQDCIVSGYSGTGAIGNTMAAAALNNRWVNCADYNNTTAYDSIIPSYQIVGRVQLTGDPFTNAAGNDFSLNSTAGAGAACRAAGIPGTFPGLATTGYRDIGVAQHQDPVAMGGPVGNNLRGGFSNG